MFRTRLTAATAVVAASLLVLTGCSSDSGDSSTSSGSEDSTANTESTAEATAGGDLTIGLDREVPTLDVTNGVIGSQPVLILGNALYEPLMTYTDGGEVVPDFAESMTADETATTWTLTIAEGLTFSDGSPFTSAEIIAHVERLSDPESGSSSAGQAAQITAMDAPDEQTVVFTLAAPNADFVAQFARNLGMVTKADTLDDAGFPIGAGPFVVEDYVSGDSVTVVPNENYSGEAPLLDSITFKMLPDADSRLQSLRSGDIDMMWTEVTSQMQESRSDDSLAVNVAPAAVSAVVLNLSDERFADVEVRTALAQAIDREAINAVVNLGEGEVVDSPYALLGDLSPTVDYPAYDPDAARAVLEPLSLSVSLNVENRTDTIQRATAVKDMLAQVGVEVTLEPVESADFGSVLVGKSFEVTDFVTSIFGDPSGGFLIANSASPYNFASYSNPDVDAATQAGAATTDPDARAEQFQIVGDNLAADLPILWLTASNVGFISQANVTGIPDLSARTLVSVQPALIGFAD